jgi:SAM-dependent methyltransferase
VTHIDDEAIAALTAHYSRVLPSTAEGNTIGHLDLCSSWVSFLPNDYSPANCVGLGMNDAELAANKQLSSYDVHDLNTNPVLPYADESFDVITNVVSVDYLAKPLQLFEEMHRVMKPAGLAIMSFSNRMFWSVSLSVILEFG